MKKNSKPNKTKKWFIIALISLIINGLVIATIVTGVIMYKTHYLDVVLTNSAIEFLGKKLCGHGGSYTIFDQQKDIGNPLSEKDIKIASDWFCEAKFE